MRPRMRARSSSSTLSGNHLHGLATGRRRHQSERPGRPEHTRVSAPRPSPSRLWRRRPLPRPALGFGELFGGHLCSEGISEPHAPLAIITGRLRDGEVEPHVGHHIVLRNALTGRIHDAKLSLSSHFSLVGGKLKPGDRLSEVLRNTEPIPVHKAEVELRVGVSLVGRGTIPAHRLNVILGDPLASGVYEPEVVLCRGVPLDWPRDETTDPPRRHSEERLLGPPNTRTRSRIAPPRHLAQPAYAAHRASLTPGDVYRERAH